MSRYFPHSAYAEDQPLGRTILTVHVATRAVTLGSIIGIGITTTRTLIPALRGASTASFGARLLNSASSSILITLGITGVGLVGRMWGRETIEWQDRSWRLLENRGQVETDDWTYAGMGAGTAAALVSMLNKGSNRPAMATMGWKGVLGAAGLGSVGGVAGYMVWRYGIHGGKFATEATRKSERPSM